MKIFGRMIDNEDDVEADVNECLNSVVFTEEEGTELELEALYRRYCVRLKHSLFVSALFVTLLCCIVLLCAVCILNAHSLHSQATTISALSVITFILTVVLSMALLPAAAEWEALALTGSVLVTVCLGAGTLMATHHAPLPLFALILMVHTMMPIARSIALGMAAALTLAYMGLAIGLGPQGMEGQFYQQLVCELALLLSASGIGLYYRALTERAHRNTFAGTRTCLEQRVKLECEREQQESLLLSVIPAYIAAEVPVIDKLFVTLHSGLTYSTAPTMASNSLRISSCD
ncbi:unnamed protein product [Danaus chrysippus]|uniref:(African queen) hypothetical protein n=1 Tax=Danaus chrysippus TaxID=151541 RepID=A0A8J2QHP3_9NEOP|nr:unnamed protein product [Danaus chrysippus]